MVAAMSWGLGLGFRSGGKGLGTPVILCLILHVILCLISILRYPCYTALDLVREVCLVEAMSCGLRLGFRGASGSIAESGHPRVRRGWGSEGPDSRGIKCKRV